MKLKAIASAGLLALMAGCGSASEPAVPNEPATADIGGRVQVVVVQVNGKPVTCVIWDGVHSGGPSCDWVGFHASDK